MGALDKAVVEHLLDPGGANDPFEKVEECLVVSSRGRTPLWECPCRDCWRMEQRLNEGMDIEDERVTYQEWKAARVEITPVIPEDIRIDRDDDDEMGYPWHVIVDMRRDNSTANYEWSDAVVAKLGTLDFQADPETSCSYFYLKTEADAKFVATVVRSVWEAGLT